MSDTDYKFERANDVAKIKTSEHPRKVVVAGPGTGKSFLFQEIIKDKKLKGKTDFIAITFIGKLGDALADDLCGLADTYTMHGFARKLVLENCDKWKYYPKISEIIKEDLKSEGIKSFEIGDENYIRKSLYYKTIGDDDVVYYAVQICKKDINKIPKHDLILVDEFQDFNEIESEFVDYLSLKNEIVIVGDDDQALYKFKGASPVYIRKKYDVNNINFESHTLRFCSRCTEVIIKYFHDIVNKFNLNDPKNNRIRKEYICYPPDKKSDSCLNPKINLITNCPPGMIAYKIKSELEKIIINQKIKQVLVIGENRSCSSVLDSIATQLVNYGFKNIDHKDNVGLLGLNPDIISAYKFIEKDIKSLLGWRILGNPTNKNDVDRHVANSKILEKIINGSQSELSKIKYDDVADLMSAVAGSTVTDQIIKRELLFKEIKNNNIFLNRPLCNLDITVCGILNSKGLGADVVFVVGFDQGRFPQKDNAIDSEVYQMLVALTRAKKRIYFINTVGKKVSNFIDCLNKENLNITDITI